MAVHQELTVQDGCLIVRSTTCCSLTKMIIPIDKIEYVQKGFAYTYLDVFLIIITLGLWYCYCLYCADARISIGHASGITTIVVVPKNKASKAYKSILAAFAPHLRVSDADTIDKV